MREFVSKTLGVLGGAVITALIIVTIVAASSGCATTSGAATRRPNWTVTHVAPGTCVENGSAIEVVAWADDEAPAKFSKILRITSRRTEALTRGWLALADCFRNWEQYRRIYVEGMDRDFIRSVAIVVTHWEDRSTGREYLLMALPLP